MTSTTRPIPQSVKNLHKSFDSENIVLAVSPHLTETLGIHKAHLISQIHYWLENSSAGYLIEGVKWIYNGYKEWAKQLPWLSVSQVGRLVRELEKEKLIITDNYNFNRYDRRKWYHLNYELIKEKTGWNPKGLKKSLPSKNSEQKSEKENSPPESPEPLISSNLQNERMNSVNPQNGFCESDRFIYKDYPPNTQNFFSGAEEENSGFPAKKEEVAVSHDSVISEEGKGDVLIDHDSPSHQDLDLDLSKGFGKTTKKEKKEEKDNFTEEGKEGVKLATQYEEKVQSQPVVGSLPREKYEWEVAVGRPHADFVRWRANLHYKPQGGHWATGAASHAVSEIIKKSESQPEAVRWMWQDFLEYAERSADNALSAEATGSTPSLPACFEEKVVDEKVVEQKLVQAKVSVRKVQGEQPALEGKAEGRSNPALVSAELTEEEKFWLLLNKKLMWLQATWKACCERTDSAFRANLLKELLDKVRSTPGLMMTDEGPMLDPDFVFVPE